jgi:hypothetical protein
MTIVVDAAYAAPGYPVPNAGPALLPDWRHPLLPLPSSSRRTVALAGWSILAIGLAFAEAIARLGARALEGMRGGLSPAEWVALAGSVLLFTWFEGYRSLHKRWVPAAVRRSFEVAARTAGALGWLVAPLRSLGLVGGTRRELVRAWAGMGLITHRRACSWSCPPCGHVDPGSPPRCSWGSAPWSPASSRRPRPSQGLA